MPVTVAAGPADGRVDLPRDVPAAGVMTRRPGVLPGGWRERCAGGVPAPHVGSCRTAACTGRTREPRCRTRSFTRLTRYGDISVCIVRFRERRGSQGCSCTPGWPGQATGAVNSGLEETSFRTAWPLVPRPSCSPWPPSRSCCWCPATARWPTRSPAIRQERQEPPPRCRRLRRSRARSRSLQHPRQRLTRPRRPRLRAPRRL